MKKIKLLTTLSGLGVIAAAIPVVSTGCNSKYDSSNYIIYKGEKVKLDGFTFTQTDINLLCTQQAVPYDPAKSDSATWSAYYINGVPYDINYITEINIGTASNVAIIPPNFMNGCVHLRTVNLNGIKDLTYIGDNFLDYCYLLSTLVLPTLKNLSGEDMINLKYLTGSISQIPEYFLYGNNQLDTIDLEPFANIRYVPEGFMESCSNIKSLDFSSWKNVSYIGSSFLWGNESLEKVNLPTIKQLDFSKEVLKQLGVDTSPVTTIGNYFMQHCTSVKSFDFTPFAEVNYIADDFLGEESGEYIFNLNISTLDFSKLTKLNRIGDGFCSQIPMVKNIKLPHMVEIEDEETEDVDKPEIGQRFLRNKSVLESIDLSPLENIEELPEYFLENCIALKTVDLTPMKALQDVGSEEPTAETTTTVIKDGFLYMCTNLEAVYMGDILAANVGIDPSISSIVEEPVYDGSGNEVSHVLVKANADEEEFVPVTIVTSNNDEKNNYFTKFVNSDPSTKETVSSWRELI